MTYCKCHQKLTHRVAAMGLWDELKEFIEEPSMDELSDVTYCLNRWIGTFVGKPYVPIFGLTKLHIDKIAVRMESHGCIRSPRHLIDGKCPSE